MIVILGPTATGKTQIATQLASLIQAEIISADSRQVYKDMDIGTGKDIAEYEVNGTKIPYHLIDILEAGEEYNVYRFQQDFLEVYSEITAKEKLPILCGGSALYLDAILKGYQLVDVPENSSLRIRMERKTKTELSDLLHSYKKLHNKTDTEDKDRLIRAIEIAEYYEKHKAEIPDFPKIKSVVFGIYFDRKRIRERITDRLQYRLDNGMIEEVEDLMQNKNISPEKLEYYGLEYKYISQYLQNKLEFREMFDKLNTAIHQFAKRQMTWFRKMENEGRKIYWINGEIPLEDKIAQMMTVLSKYQF
jgi:tRNA dimethylallyltransferase